MEDMKERTVNNTFPEQRKSIIKMIYLADGKGNRVAENH